MRVIAAEPAILATGAGNCAWAGGGAEGQSQPGILFGSGSKRGDRAKAGSQSVLHNRHDLNIHQLTGPKTQLANRRAASLSSLFSDACKRQDIAIEEAVGCERVENTLVLHLPPDEQIVFEIEIDEDGLPRGLGQIIESDAAIS